MLTPHSEGKKYWNITLDRFVGFTLWATHQAYTIHEMIWIGGYLLPVRVRGFAYQPSQ